jgi:hypothetical protein
MSHKIAIKIKRKEWEEITLGWFASLMGSCSPRVVFPLVRHGLGALGYILTARASCLAGSTQRYSEPAFLHKILLAGYKDEWKHWGLL